ncbi:MAG: Holliday junction branch migration protein RuvA [Clostridiales bacterium]|jgi:Holliday junction DNA helicase RuvA|nr:Holliday junction branch migration protein RuvA [Clostridiales bacterium]
MIYYLRGEITMDFEGGIVLETGGVGYKVYIPDNSPLYQKKGEEVVVKIEMVMREDDISLYGFHDMESLDLFQKLRTVNGVGAKAALSLLSAMPLNELIKSIITNDITSLCRAYGIGKKTAQRIVLELKDKLDDRGLSDIVETVRTDSNKTEAVNALIGLGFTKNEALSALAEVKGEDLTTEEYIKQALRGTSTK